MLTIVIGESAQRRVESLDCEMSRASNFVRAMWCALAALVVTTAYEAAKSVSAPHLTFWQSHLLTILYSSVVTFVLSLALLGRWQRKTALLDHQKLAFETLSDHMPGLACLVTPEWKLLRWNPRFQHVLGYSDEELPQMMAAQTFSPQYRELFPIRMGEAWTSGHAELEAAWLTKSGETIPCYLTGVRVLIGDRPCILSVGIDITEQKRAEEALRRSEEQYRRLLANLPDVTWTLDSEGNITYISGNVEELLGYTPQDVLGGGLDLRLTRIHPEDADLALKNYRALFLENKIFAVEYRMRHKDGRWIWVRNRALRTYQQDGKLFADGILTDITELKQAEKIDSQLAAIVTSSGDAIIGGAVDGTIVSWNHGAQKMYGYAADEAIGKRISMVVPPERLHEVPEILGKIARGEQIQRFDSVCLRKDGTRFDVSLAIATIKDKGGRVLGISTIAHDITLRKQAEDTLRRSEQSLALRNQIFNVFLTLPDQQMYTEVLQIVLNATDSRHGLFGYVADDGALQVPSMTSEVQEACQVVNKDLRFPHEAWAGIWRRALTEKRAFYSNNRASVPGGHIAIVRSMAVPILYQDVAIGLLVVANKKTDYQEIDRQLLERVAVYLAPVLSARLQRDTQERARQRTERELIKAKNLAEQANRAKTQFLANMSHELRTPMNGILGMAELALDTQLDAQQRESLLVIQSSGSALLRLIEDLLDFTRTESGTLALDSIAFNLHETVRQTLRPLRFQAQQVGLEFRYQMDPELPDMVFGDPQRLRQVLVNVVGNAIKFTHQGKVVVRAACNSLSADSAEVLFKISDTGIGVSPEKQAAIFNGFTQSDGSLARKYGGTGLGLAISSHLVELMNGKIWVESQLGHGSTFCFTVHLPVSEHGRRAFHPELAEAAF